MAAENRKKIFDKIQSVIQKNDIFPKHLSIVYDDRSIKHTTHIVLSFESKNKCTLNIDNTLSPLAFFSDCIEMLENQLNINTEECKEKVSGRFLELYNNTPDEKKSVKLELSIPIDQLFIQKVYKRMVETLMTIGINLTSVKINHSPNNQKSSLECVNYSIQNKINYITGLENKSNETARQKGIRIRAEHVVLSYLFTGNTHIPKFSEQEIIDYKLQYEEGCWYPNLPEVCKNIDQALKKLSFNDLNKLYLTTEIDGTNQISNTFKELLCAAMKDKIPVDEYTQIKTKNNSLDCILERSKSQFIENTMAPNIFYHKDKESLFISNEFLFFMNNKNNRNQNNERNDMSVEKMVTNYFSFLR